MDIIVPFSIRRAELDGVVSEEAKKKLRLALADLLASTETKHLYEQF